MFRRGEGGGGGGQPHSSQVNDTPCFVLQGVVQGEGAEKEVRRQRAGARAETAESQWC